jgi:hypothetical protein
VRITLRLLCEKLHEYGKFLTKLLVSLKTSHTAGRSKPILEKFGWDDMYIKAQMSEAFNAGWFPEDDSDHQEERDIVLKTLARERRLVRKPKVWYARSAH